VESQTDQEIMLNVVVMSGVDDGTLLSFRSDNNDGSMTVDKWTITIGRRDENDICLRNDTYVSRQHAKIHYKNGSWWLEDCNSTNGTFIENPEDFFDDQPVKGIIQIDEGQLFRVGRTWLRIQTAE
jgi:pSer/pThr/pTyr-binding forkhead associated (FHA) protein